MLCLKAVLEFLFLDLLMAEKYSEKVKCLGGMCYDMVRGR